MITVTGTMPIISTYGTWVETMELRDIDDDSLWDTSMFTEIQVKLRDPRTGADELVLKLSDGSVTRPSPGILQWRAEASVMGTLPAKVYEGIILLHDATDIVPLLMGPRPVVGEGASFT